MKADNITSQSGVDQYLLHGQSYTPDSSSTGSTSEEATFALLWKNVLLNGTLNY